MILGAPLSLLLAAPPLDPPPSHRLPSAVEVAGSPRPLPDPAPKPGVSAAPPPTRKPSAPGGSVTAYAASHRPLEMPPPTGSGLLGGGIGLLGVGVMSMSVSLVVFNDERAGAPVSGPVTLGLGLLTAAGGAVSTYYGVRRRRRYAAWLDDARVSDEPSGLGFIAGGGALTGAGVIGLALTAAEVDTRSAGAGASLLYVTFGGVAVTGVTLAAVGWARHRRHIAWLRALPIQWSPFVGPAAARGSGAAAGVMGRF